MTTDLQRIIANSNGPGALLVTGSFALHYTTTFSGQQEKSGKSETVLQNYLS